MVEERLRKKLNGPYGYKQVKHTIDDLKKKREDILRDLNAKLRYGKAFVATKTPQDAITKALKMNHRYVSKISSSQELIRKILMKSWKLSAA
jgi:hypothetical protein